MSLKGFHIFFITVATLLAFGFCAWCIHAYMGDKKDMYIGLGGSSFLAGVGLIVYGISFLRKIKRLHL
jgi:hypothetical protein